MDILQFINLLVWHILCLNFPSNERLFSMLKYLKKLKQFVSIVRRKNQWEACTRTTPSTTCTSLPRRRGETTSWRSWLRAPKASWRWLEASSPWKNRLLGSSAWPVPRRCQISWRFRSRSGNGGRSQKAASLDKLEQYLDITLNLQ